MYIYISHMLFIKPLYSARIEPIAALWTRRAIYIIPYKLIIILTPAESVNFRRDV